MLTDATPKLLAPCEVAQLIGQHRATVYRKIAAGEIPAVRLGPPGSSIRVPERALERWLWSSELEET